MPQRIFIFLCMSFGALNNAFAAGGWEIPRSKVLEVEQPLEGRHYSVFVQLPPGYDDDKNRSRTYPAIYLNDGPYTFTVAAGEIYLPAMRNEFEDVILVGISWAEGEDLRASRTRDFTPSVEPTYHDVSGGGPAYLGYFEDVIVPMIERRFRADPSRRVLSGQSFGGLFGVYAMLEKPELFSGYILTSTAFGYNDFEIFDREKRFAEEVGELKAQVYLAVGEMEDPAQSGKDQHDLVGEQKRFETVMRSRGYKGLELKTEVVGGKATHGTTFPVGFLRGMQWMFATEDEN